MRPASRRDAFTLIELLVVIAIIALLAALLLPSLHSARASARKAACMSNLKQISMGMMMYLQSNQDCYPSAEDPVSVAPMYWLWMGRGWRSKLNPYIENDKVFWCPVDTTAVSNYDSTSYAYSMSFYHSVEQINSMKTPASTYSNPQPPVRQSEGQVALPARKILIGEWMSNHRRVAQESGWWNWQGSRNFLFVDGHVEHREAERIRAANDNLPDPNLTIDGIAGADVE